MEESTLALAQSLAKQTIYEESPPGSPRAGRSHAQLLQEKVQGFRWDIVTKFFFSEYGYHLLFSPPLFFVNKSI